MLSCAMLGAGPFAAGPEHGTSAWKVSSVAPLAPAHATVRCTCKPLSPTREGTTSIMCVGPWQPCSMRGTSGSQSLPSTRYVGRRPRKPSSQKAMASRSCRIRTSVPASSLVTVAVGAIRSSSSRRAAVAAWLWARSSSSAALPKSWYHVHLWSHTSLRPSGSGSCRLMLVATSWATICPVHAVPVTEQSQSTGVRACSFLAEPALGSILTGKGTSRVAVR
mmetsp:Transcript_41529/g.101906  ORF Transcript_41529/g.101906 Transcript_41529/m.101906 type:complete len:221 (-) Transcript_41529:432-1094(-)